MVADDGDSDSDDTAECLREMLGGVSFEGVAAAAWDAPAEGREGAAVAEGTRRPKTTDATPTPSKEINYSLRDDTSAVESETAFIFRNAFRSLLTEPGLARPPVRIVAIPSKGNGLVATGRIGRGAVIYTERALLAVPDIYASLQACQHCFRSLEPVSKLSELAPEAPQRLPHTDLWPNPEFRYPDTEQEPCQGSTRRDDFGRVTCRTCGSLFCCGACYRAFTDLLGSCCAAAAVQRMEHTDQAAALAARLFAYSLQLYRTSGGLDQSLLRGLCGHADDVNSLELGEQDVQSSTYSLQSVYESLVSVYAMSPAETQVLTLEQLHTLAAVAARNGVGFATRSPFQQYYAAALRSTGGRGSAGHATLQRRVATALGAPDGALRRSMDRDADALVAVRLAALFLLTARANHSCNPNACVQSQVYCDSHMDLVALRDIERGEEITISYIGVGHGMGVKNKFRRQRELQAKYLFLCHCTECSK